MPVMGRFGVELLLVVFATILTLGFLVTYIVSVHEGHVTPDLPYISDTGGMAPEQCIFSLVCNIGSILLLLIIYIRFQYIHQYYKDTIPKIHCLNVVTLGLGALSAAGFIIVGSFQNDVVPVVHFIGAFIVFGFGVLYNWTQTYMSYKIYHTDLTRHAGSVIIVIRLLVCILTSIFFVLSVVAATIAGREHKHDESPKGTFIWKEGDGGFSLHVVSTASEWAAAFSFLLFFLTYHSDFVRIRLNIQVSLRGPDRAAINESTPLTI